MEYSRQEYWSDLPFPSPGDFPDPGIELTSPALQATSLLLSHLGISFKTTSVGANTSAIIVEGIIKFTSGAQKKTGFIFEAKDTNAKGQVRFTGSNKHLCESSDAFTLVGKIDNKKLFVESLKYNYKVNNNTVRGIVRKK